MGYTSDVRIVTSKKGFKELKKYVDNYLKDKNEYNLLDNIQYKTDNKYSCYFGWDYVKWYEESYDSVIAIMDGLDHLRENNYSYRYSRIGENYDDYDEHYFESEIEDEQDLEFPSLIRAFDDYYVISNMINADKETVIENEQSV